MKNDSDQNIKRLAEGIANLGIRMDQAKKNIFANYRRLYQTIKKEEELHHEQAAELSIVLGISKHAAFDLVEDLHKNHIDFKRVCRLMLAGLEPEEAKTLASKLDGEILDAAYRILIGGFPPASALKPKKDPPMNPGAGKDQQ